MPVTFGKVGVTPLAIYVVNYRDNNVNNQLKDFFNEKYRKRKEKDKSSLWR